MLLHHIHNNFVVVIKVHKKCFINEIWSKLLLLIYNNLWSGYFSTRLSGGWDSPDRGSLASFWNGSSQNIVGDPCRVTGVTSNNSSKQFLWNFLFEGIEKEEKRAHYIRYLVGIERKEKSITTYILFQLHQNMKAQDFRATGFGKLLFSNESHTV